MSEKINSETGEVTSPSFGKVKTIISLRPNGRPRIQRDYSDCVTLTEQHSAHLTDINYLINKFKPDELNAYLAARETYRAEILGHDFSKEPSLQEAKNIVYKSQQEFNNLSPDIKNLFKNHVEFLKFIDNPANAEKMLKLGILTPKKLSNLQSLESVPETDAAKKDADAGEGQKSKSSSSDNSKK